MLRDTTPKDNPDESLRREKEKDMSNALIIFKQTVIMFLYMAAGFTLFLPFPGLPGAMKTALYIAAMAPVGANAAVYAQKQGRDYSYAVGLVCLSTLFSVVTMPLLILLAR